MLLRSTLIYLPALFLPRIATFVLVIAATRLLPIGEYGLFALVTLVGEIAEGVSTNWLRVALLRFSGGSATVSVALWRAAARANLWTTAIALGCTLPVTIVLVPDRAGAFWFAVAVYVVATAALRLGLSILQATGARTTYAAIEASRAAAMLACPIGAVLFLSPDFVVASLAGSIATALFATAALGTARRYVDSGATSIDPRALRVYAAPIVTVTGAGYAVASIERLVLQMLAGAAAVGGYSAAHALARQPLEVFGNAVNAGGFPQLVKRYERDGEEGARQAVGIQLDLLLTVLLPAVAGIFALRSSLAATILPAAYGGTAVAVLPPVAFGAACFTIRSTIFDSIFHLQKRSWVVLGYLLPAAFLSLVVACASIPSRGAEGAAWAFAAGSAVSLPFSIWAARRFVPAGFACRCLLAACATALAVGLGAASGASLVPWAAVLQLAAGLGAGGAAFVLSQIALRPEGVRLALRRMPMPATAGR